MTTFLHVHAFSLHGTGIRYVKVRVDDARRLLELAALTNDQSPGERSAVRRVASVMP